ncbi:hypothetical protein Caci_0356 [Catenulispora acidiphila DSM 44928]|uniref:DUF11 domain-containing protein n=1 Tax=Catenulispora acidiphila (strain DSM 44928 / JCM 14897 / NBRC 102108 / NRRL B-24433 / ID139908) TaxID=479433 RepID=C7PVF3_CATAD|nr:hypothetical protein [Catenulispora acidiphila]ACU69309.1 hypothetical protein Caci_0356 [Catenulispora acidiphila DSM 44928]
MGAATALTLLGPAAASAAADTTPAPPAGVTVDVLGGSTPADEHAAIDYTIELRDAGTVPYRHVAVTAMLPPGFHILRASPALAASAGPGSMPTWTADLLPGRTVDIHAEITAGTVQDLAEAAEPLTGPSDVLDGSGPGSGSSSGAMAWYSLSACAQSGPSGVPVCGLSRQLLVKTDDDTRRGIEAMVLILGVPLLVGGLGVYAWRARREPDMD